MLKRLENYIRGVLTFVQENYPGVIYAWDVVNEVIDEGDFRKSLWTETVGTDFVIKAFEFAKKYKAPEVNFSITTTILSSPGKETSLSKRS